MVPQKSIFWKKIVEKVLNTCLTPPLVSRLRDITREYQGSKERDQLTQKLEGFDIKRNGSA